MKIKINIISMLHTLELLQNPFDADRHVDTTDKLADRRTDGWRLNFRLHLMKLVLLSCQPRVTVT